ncbi:MAG UNVERIFIED_CONTAM: hypothetical protein LVR29_13280 [Microcystis novacekii LVE1205-3]|jgi:microcystin synthetase protein McyE
MVDVKPTIDSALKEFQYPIVSESAQGAYFKDIDGNNYIDLAMGFGVNFLGIVQILSLKRFKNK